MEVPQQSASLYQICSTFSILFLLEGIFGTPQTSFLLAFPPLWRFDTAPNMHRNATSRHVMSRACRKCSCHLIFGGTSKISWTATSAWGARTQLAFSRRFDVLFSASSNSLYPPGWYRFSMIHWAFVAYSGRSILPWEITQPSTSQNHPWGHSVRIFPHRYGPLYRANSGTV